MIDVKTYGVQFYELYKDNIVVSYIFVNFITKFYSLLNKNYGCNFNNIYYTS